MDKVAKAAEALTRALMKGDTLLYAQVKAITGDTCTVTIGQLELTDVRLKATDDGNQDKLLVVPAVGSMVMVGANNGSLRDLVVLKVDDPEVISYKHKDVLVNINAKTGLMEVKNQHKSLKALFDDLMTIIEQLTVSTPAGPSGTPLPPTLAQVAQFKADLSKILK
ncbi:MAG: hypothetical protein ACNA7V_06680 [Bacteroidales bacterium]